MTLDKFLKDEKLGEIKITAWPHFPDHWFQPYYQASDTYYGLDHEGKHVSYKFDCLGSRSVNGHWQIWQEPKKKKRKYAMFYHVTTRAVRFLENKAEVDMWSDNLEFYLRIPGTEVEME